MAHWFNIPSPKFPLVGDVKKMKKFISILTNSSPNRAFYIENPFVGSRSQGVKKNTVIRAIDNGHLSSNIWFYVNNVQKYHRVSESNGKQFHFSELSSARGEFPKNWVLDMDNVPGIAGETSLDRISYLVEKLKSFECPLPLMIVETSIASFHLLFHGIKEEWSDSRRYAVALRASGCTKKVTDVKERDSILKAGGVDPNYMSQNPGMAKMRLPGSVNVHKSMGKVTTWRVDKLVVIEGWINPNYHSLTNTQISSLDFFEDTEVKEKAVSKKKDEDTVWKIFYPMVKEVLASSLKGKPLKDISKFLSKNKNFLLQGKLRIHQEFLASELGITQCAVSKILKKLKDNNVLVVTAGYVKGKCAKSYGCSEKLKVCFEQKVKKEYNPYVEYRAGEFNTQFLEDIRGMSRMGWSKDRIIQTIMSKQDMRGKRSRTINEVAKAVDSWFNIKRDFEFVKLEAM
jgi:DNA-binding Lrp family transcriptional regulator